MTDHFIHIYTHRADDYHRAIAHEDADGNLLKAIESVTALDGKRILDLGTGTGRLPLLLAGRAAQFVGLDLHWDMLRQSSYQRSVVGGQWRLVQGDMRRLPFPSGWADVVTAGWAIGHLCGWYAADWQIHIGRVLNEMHRAAAPGGTLFIFETLTTGSLTPAPPTEELAEYYNWLENEWGFTRQAISTDYQFASVDEAVARTEFFFGPEMAEKIRANNWVRLPEWTGMWVKRQAG
jgi:ubiquinone/menaquinone biosynthesis C-methylase UbiE